MSRPLLSHFVQNVLQIRDPLDVSVDEIEELLIPNGMFRITGVYGKGEYGIVFRVETTSGFSGGEAARGTYALKVAHLPAQATSAVLREFEIQKEFAEYRMAPTVHLVDTKVAQFRGQPVRFVRALMDPIRSTLYDALTSVAMARRLVRALRCLIHKKYILQYPTPYMHADMHLRNIALLKDGKTLGFIDFGLSVPRPAYTQFLDGIPLMAHMKFASQERHPVPEAMEELLQSTLKIYNDLFQVQLEAERLRRFPEGGFHYAARGVVLHSYAWTEDLTRNRTRLPSEALVRYIFPFFEVPAVRDN
jgi:hypothetical protein